MSDWAVTWTVVDDLELVQDSSNGEWRRLVFLETGFADDEGNPYIKYPMVLYHLVEDDWVFSNATQLGSYKLDHQGNEIQIEDLKFHSLFELPPTFPDLQLEKTEPPEGGLESQPMRPKDSLRLKLKNK